MELVKKISLGITGIAFWSYVFALLFIEDTYIPFITQKETTSTVEVSRTDAQPRKQQSGTTGISVFTSTDTVGRKQQLHFSSPLTKGAAIKSARESCQRHIAHTDGSLFCEEVTFFYNGCFVRYRVGNGNATAIRATQVEAAAEAERKCKALAKGTGYACRRDTNICISGGDNQGTRHWDRSAVGLSKLFEIENGRRTQVTILEGNGDSTQSAKNNAAAKCLSISGQSCRDIMTLEGDKCLAIAYSAGKAYAVRHGGNEDKAKLKAQAMSACSSASNKPCRVQWKCAGSRFE